MPDSKPEEVNLRDEFGPMLVGLVFAAMLGGITIVQALTFIRTSKRDPVQHKLAVHSLLFLDMLHLCFFAHSVHHYLVSRPDDTSVVWSFPAFILIHNILMPMVQSFYAARIWKLSPRSRIYLPIISTLMLLVNLSFGMVISGILCRIESFAKVLSLFPSDTIKASFVIRVCSDIFIAGSMVFSLAKAGTDLSWTDSSSTMLLAYLLNTGTIASLVSIAVFVSVLAVPQTLLFLAIEEIATKLYVNSFMGMLNARYYLQPASHKPTPSFFFRTSYAGPTDRVRVRTPQKTINEVGLPLFQSDSRKDETDSDIKVEVTVKQDTQRTTN